MHMQATYLFLFSIIPGKFCHNLHCNRLYFYHPLLHRSNTDATSLNIHTRHNVSNIILFHSSASFGISLLLFVLSCTLHFPIHILFQKSIYNLLLCLFFRQSQCHQFNQLFSCYFSNCCLMNQCCIDIIRCKRRNCLHLSIVHDDGITFCMSAACIITTNIRNKLLVGISLCYRTRYHICTGMCSI